jgi:hypothetical protein
MPIDRGRGFASVSALRVWRRGFSEVPDHIEYVSVRPDIEKVLPAAYVNPALKR